jgi:hypothetical protein
MIGTRPDYRDVDGRLEAGACRGERPAIGRRLPDAGGGTRPQAARGDGQLCEDPLC